MPCDSVVCVKSDGDVHDGDCGSGGSNSLSVSHGHVYACGFCGDGKPEAVG